MKDIEKPNFFNAADYFLDRNIREGRGNKIAIFTEDCSYTYKNLQQMVNKTANMLGEINTRIEDRVMLALLDIPQFYGVFWGAIKIGAVPVPVNTMLTPKDYEFLLNDSRARVLAVSEELLPVIDNIEGALPYLRDVLIISQKNGAQIPFKQKYNNSSSAKLNTAFTKPDDVGFWLYSSGSTGTPKGTIHSQYDMVVASRSYAQDVLHLTEDDICFSAARMFFAYGLGNSVYFPMAVGASAVITPQSPSPEVVFHYLKKFRPTVFFGIPTLYGQMLEYQELVDAKKGLTDPDLNGNHALSSVRICASAGEPLPTNIYHRWKKRFGVDILDGLGSTEMAHIFLSNRPGHIKPGSSGKPVPGYKLKLLDDCGKEVPQGEIGTLFVKGDSAAQFYWRKRQKTRQTMVGEWVNTGDNYYVDNEGYYWCAGRSDDMIKSGGIWVSPVEVENCLGEHPAVKECAVVGHDDGKSLTKPKAFVVLREDYESCIELAEELKKWVLDRLAKYKYPRWVEFVECLPKSATGKIQRVKLRQSSCEGT